MCNEVLGSDRKGATAPEAVDGTSDRFEVETGRYATISGTAEHSYANLPLEPHVFYAPAGVLAVDDNGQPLELSCVQVAARVW